MMGFNDGMPCGNESVRDMSRSEKEAFSLGVLQNIEDQAARSVEGANTAYNVYKTPQKRRVLRLAFPEGEQGQKQYDQIIVALETEARMATTESRGLGGSQTAERTEAMRMLNESINRTLKKELNEYARSVDL